MKCPTDVPRDAKGLVQARVATRTHAERTSRWTVKELVRLQNELTVREVLGDSGVSYPVEG